MRQYLRGFVQRDDTGGTGDGLITVVAATEGRKADGIDLRMDTLDLGRFQANPVIMYGHDYFGRDSLPIGRAEETVVDSSRLLERLRFDAADPFAATVDRKMRDGFLNAVSIGFDAHDIGEDGVPARWELFETSVVPLPLDADALVESGRGRRHLALARLLDAGRAGKVLSGRNQTLVEDAIAALTALLEAAAAAKEDQADEADDEGRGRRPRLDSARARLLAARY